MRCLQFINLAVVIGCKCKHYSDTEVQNDIKLSSFSDLLFYFTLKMPLNVQKQYSFVKK